MKHLKYLWYVIRHKWYVFIECCKLGIPIRGILHDLSKFKPSEWLPYVNKFYGNYPEFKKMLGNLKATYTGKTKEQIEIEFDKAWLHHQKNNKHHWQYWILQKDSGEQTLLEMPDKYKKEMLADWIGAGKSINGTNEVKKWYWLNKDKMTLNPFTRSWIQDNIYSEMDWIVLDKLVNEEKEVCEIVLYWWLGNCVNYNYKDNFTEEQYENAHEIIMEIVLMGIE